MLGCGQRAVAQSNDNAAPIATQLLIGARLAKPLNWAEELAVRPLDAFKECAVCPEMVVMPAGTFTMGSPDSEKDREDNESPQRSVTFATCLRWVDSQSRLMNGMPALPMGVAAGTARQTTAGVVANGRW
jgi:hypothetical protein